MKKSKVGFLFVLPTVVLLGAIVVYPIIRVIYQSAFKLSIFQTSLIFNFPQNFTYLLRSSSFWKSIYNSFIWTGIGVPLQVLIGLCIALLVNRNFKGRDFLRGAVFFPYLVPDIMASMVWTFMFNDLYGVLNYMLLKIGIISQPICWFSHPNTAMIGLIVVGLWKFSPFCVLGILACLQTIPNELYEASRIDGATPLQEFRFITLPTVLPVMLIIGLLRLIWVFNNFDLIYLTTQGGPLEATTTLPIYIYEEAFQQYNLGRASAGGMLMLIILLLTTSYYIKKVGRNV
jgi:multiple sugar transport system permease protein